MQYRDYFRSMNPGAAFCLLLTFTILLGGARRSDAQAAAATQDNVAPAVPANSLRLEGHLPGKIANGTAFRVSRYARENKLRLVLAIQPPHMAEEETFIKQLTTKGSPNFHKFLTQNEWNARFAPSAEDEQAVVNWAQSQGLTVTQRYPNRLLVDIEGTAETIEK